MDYKQSEEIINLLKKQIELLEKIYVVFSKYDEEFQQSSDYLIEVKKDGLGHTNG